MESHRIKIEEVGYNRFTMTPKRWKDNLNAEMINQGIAQNKRLERLNEIAKKQLAILQDSSGIKKIEKMDNIILI